MKFEVFMATVHRFGDLEVLQLTRGLASSIFKLTHFEGFREKYALKDQIQGSSGSIMDNIAEGFDKGGNKELIYFFP